ncbi:tetratricopeptide repeat protein [uncultured Desulfuromonas sp.]|uniref:tetratricopeptide repeat protein n=1 Tax=uncultured Desulfuromonas sp. TaxID=181013 RepID=UPI00263581F7|nr:tetratricopeptide repeat protein [uncultured Desulfuromonas sp.]
MSIWNKIFGKSDPLSAGRRALQQRRWADALCHGESIDRDTLAPELLEGLDNLLIEARDGLAELNLSEGQACLRAGNADRAGDHFSLAAGQAVSPELKERVAESLAELEKGIPEAPLAKKTNGGSCGTGCGSTCSPGGDDGEGDGDAPEDGLDAETRLELVLATYPPELADRYRSSGAALREVLLLVHQGAEDEALAALERVPSGERSDLFHFEQGALLARLGKSKQGVKALETALSLNPSNLLAFEALVGLLSAAGQFRQVEQRLEKALADGIEPGFCHARLAAIRSRKGDLDGALAHGQKALQSGHVESETVFLTATLLERRGDLDGAEELLQRLGGGGCGGGGGNPLLGEFWLRHNKNLDQALESFKGALRQEPDNPRWTMRIGQAYIGRGWVKEGVPLLQKALSSSDLPPELGEEGKALLATCGKGK